MSIKCFLLTETNRVRRRLRRYHSSELEGTCPGKYGYHNAAALIDEIEDTLDVLGGDLWPHDDPRWPKKCEYCDYVFPESDQWQLDCQHLFKRSDTGELVTLHDAPPGAIWDATWYPNEWKRPDGRYLICRLPDGRDWAIDGKCSNCTRPQEPHQCWVRHGEPPDLHVDKNGDTCAAGAGSIMVENWHGFLHNGHLVQC